MQLRAVGVEAIRSALQRAKPAGASTISLCQSLSLSLHTLPMSLYTLPMSRSSSTQHTASHTATSHSVLRDAGTHSTKQHNPHLPLHTILSFTSACLQVTDWLLAQEVDGEMHLALSYHRLLENLKDTEMPSLYRAAQAQLLFSLYVDREPSEVSVSCVTFALSLSFMFHFGCLSSTHTHTIKTSRSILMLILTHDALSLLVVMIKSKELKTKISHTHSLILSHYGPPLCPSEY